MGLGPAKEINWGGGWGEEKQMNGCFKKCWQQINVAPHFTLVSNRICLRGFTFPEGKEETLPKVNTPREYYLLWDQEFGCIHLPEHDKEHVPITTSPEEFVEEA